MTLEQELSHRLGMPVASCRQLSGGDLSDVFAVRLGDGQQLVVKRSASAEAEARMLTAILATGCPAPEVILSADGILAMERLPDGGLPGPAAWEHAGRAIAQLHDAHGDRYGWEADHAFGPIPIPNSPLDDWPGFWIERRMLAAPDALPKDLRARLEALARSLPDRLPATPPPSLLHGDLWSGNLLFGPSGVSGLIDPAAYYGDAEVDLAMLALFGEASPYFLEGYGGLRDGWEERRPVYQLWPALVHLQLFGRRYHGMVDDLLGQTGF